jgi:hypothetical protein
VHPSGGGPKPRLPDRDRRAHGERLKRQLEAVQLQTAGLEQRRQAVGVPADRGLYLEFESEPRFELALKSLEHQGKGIELMSARQQGDRNFATVFVPEGKLGHFVKLVEQFLAQDTRSGRPRNEAALAPIAEIRRAVFESFWTDDDAVRPAPGETLWWEVWLRRGVDDQTLAADFERMATRDGLTLAASRVDLFDRTVLLAFGTREQLMGSVDLLDCLAELRRAKESPTFFVHLAAREQRAWVDEVLGRLQPPVAGAPAVCILDTGVNNGHPLLAPLLPTRHHLTCDPEWGADDHQGHGTEMAGLASFGDLTEVLARPSPVQLEHALESVKLLPRAGENPRHLYGALTSQATSRIEIVEPHRRRVFNLAVTAPDFRDRGAPSSWSAMLDDLAAGVDGGPRRLYVVAAGNVEQDNWRNYPEGNETDQVHDPAQAWNVLTVGTSTERVHFDTAAYPGWRPIAPGGQLGPSSTTSVTWDDRWPNKPDLVVEGGNAIVDGAGEVDLPDDLQLLTTHWRLLERLFTTTGQTSAATAQVARMAAVLTARYPRLWPETLRALIVQSARWTPAMLAEIARLPRTEQVRMMLRRYGYGVPDLGRASWSASNALTLIAQDEVIPFEAGSSGGRTKDMNLHALPWPRAELLALGAVDVELRVTLSYFIEANPARRGWTDTATRPTDYGLPFESRGKPTSTTSERA